MRSNKSNNRDVIGQIIETAFQVGRALRTRIDRTADGLHMNQLHALGYIRRNSGVTMTRFAEILNITTPSATSFINRLEKMGYVRRQHDKKNRKLVRLVITPSGTRILKSKLSEKKKVVCHMLSVLSNEDQRGLLEILKKIAIHCSNS